MNALKSQSRYEDKAASARRLAYYFYATFVAAAIAASLILISGSVNAQTSGPTPPAGPAASSAAPALPRYSTTEIERAFNFMDANKDGRISREEAAGFRSVARHFDAADTSLDNSLSLEEFGTALNRP